MSRTACSVAQASEVPPLAAAEATAKDVAELEQEKAARTEAQKKLDSQIVLALKKARGEPPFDKPTTVQPDLTIRPDGRVSVDMDAAVSQELLEQIERAGGKVVSSFAASRTIRAWIPLEKIESLAARDDVKFISPAATAATN